MSDPGMRVDPRNRRELRLVVASLVASVGIHAAAFGVFSPVATEAGDLTPPIIVNLRRAPRAVAVPPAEVATSVPIVSLSPVPPRALRESNDSRIVPRAPAVPPQESAPSDPIAAQAPVARRAPRIVPTERRVAATPSKESLVRAPVKRPAPAIPPPVAVARMPAPSAPATASPAEVSNTLSVMVAPRVPPREGAVAATTSPRFRADYLSNPAPAYPRRARRAGMEGTVMLKVRVTAKGAPGDVEIETSSGFDTLDRAAVDAVKAWRFVPARRGDDAIEAWVVVPVVFRLESG